MANKVFLGDGHLCNNENEEDYSDSSTCSDDIYEPPLVVNPRLEMINQIAHLVLPRLPASTLLRFRSVSPYFYDLISSPFMVHLHFLHPRSLSGLFYHTGNGICYVSFDPPLSNLPDPSLSYLPEPVAIKASTHGMLCVRGQHTLNYYITNPTTMEWVDLPHPTVDHHDDVAVVVVFDEPSVYNFSGNYRVVCACAVEGIEGVYTFETFSSDEWAWAQSEEICEVENIVAESGTAVGTVAYWRTTFMNRPHVLSYNPVNDTRNIMQKPHPEMMRGWWELGEMDGQLSVTSRSTQGQIMVNTMEATDEEGNPHWMEMGSFQVSDWIHAPPIRSQGSAKLVMWENERLVLRDMRGVTVSEFEMPDYCAGFVPYISTLVPVRSFSPDAGTSTEPSVENNDVGFRSDAGTSTEHSLNNNDVMLQEETGNIGEEASG